MPGALRPPPPQPAAKAGSGSGSSGSAPSSKSSSQSKPQAKSQNSNQKPPASTAFNPNTAATTSSDPFSTGLDESWVIKGETDRKVASPAGLANAKSGVFGLKTPLVDFQQPNNVSIIDLIKQLYTMQPGELKSLQQRMVEANYLNSKDATSGLSNVTGLMDSRTLTAYESLLTDVYRYQQTDPNAPMTVDDMLNKKIAAYQAGGGNTQTQTQVNLFNPLQAQSFLQGAAAKLLGRDPNPGEITGFVSALNSYQQQNPDVIQVTQNADGTKSTQTNKAGITSLHGGDAAAQNYLLNDQGGDVAQHSQNVAMQSLLSMLGVGALPGMSGG